MHAGVTISRAAGSIRREMLLECFCQWPAPALMLARGRTRQAVCLAIRAVVWSPWSSFGPFEIARPDGKGSPMPLFNRSSCVEDVGRDAMPQQADKA